MLSLRRLLALSIAVCTLKLVRTILGLQFNNLLKVGSCCSNLDAAAAVQERSPVVVRRSGRVRDGGSGQDGGVDAARAANAARVADAARAANAAVTGLA